MPGVPTVTQVLQAILATVPIDTAHTMDYERSGPYALTEDRRSGRQFRQTIKAAGLKIELEAVRKVAVFIKRFRRRIIFDDSDGGSAAVCELAADDRGADGLSAWRWGGWEGAFLMWYEKAGEGALKKILAKGPSVAEGIRALLDYFQQRHPLLRSGRNLPPSTTRRTFRAMVKWFQRQFPIDDKVEVLWLAIHDVPEGLTCAEVVAGRMTRRLELVVRRRFSRDFVWVAGPAKDGKAFEAIRRSHFYMSKKGVEELVEFFLDHRLRQPGGDGDLQEISPELLLGGRKERWIVTGFPDAVYGVILGHVDRDGFHTFIGGSGKKAPKRKR